MFKPQTLYQRINFRFVRSYYTETPLVTPKQLWPYESLQRWKNPPERKVEADEERLRKICRVLKVSQYDLRITNINELRKCLYISKNFKVQAGPTNDDTYPLKELIYMGYSELHQKLSKWLDNLPKNMLKTNPAFTPDTGTHETAYMLIDQFLIRKKLKYLARLSKCETKILPKVRKASDVECFCCIIGYLYVCNGQTTMDRLLDETIVKPIIRRVVRLS
ncbi:HCL219Wp [Eremothecium sinecaudum]|uniref:HCL219Wp n=1 Tax=Eremothecium sinecaudum TaxID=45286 RepID=A0A0X8HR62_9SACH|nr:HCL219Wp [Eremothecium sinecaudum]AMD19932.1 HCL219Wp [Eremothecium sinecaudum]